MYSFDTEKMEERQINFCSLPEDCIATILSLTTPRDVSIFSCVSSTLRSAAESNLVWDRFIPADHQKTLSNPSSPVKFSTKKDLYLRLCDPILVDDAKKSFSLDRSTGKKCYMLSARELTLAFASNPMYWYWKPHPLSRFSEVAVLRYIWWLEINGKIKTSVLSPNTTYGAYLVVQIDDRAYGLDTIPSEIYVEVRGSEVYAGTACLGMQDSQKKMMERLFLMNQMEMVRSRVIKGDDRAPRERQDGWLEIELGEFYVNGEDECREVKMSLKGINGDHLRGGLIVEGIEIRPKH